MSERPSGKPTDGVISRYINRRISGRITSYILENDIDVTPTQVSIFSFSLGIFASLLYLFDFLILAGILVQLSSIIDGVDGELARARNMVSRLGGFIDTILDRVVNIAIITSITLLLLFRTGPDYIVALVGLLALSADLLVTYLHAVSQKDLGVHPALVGSIPPIASRDVRLFIIFLASLIGVLDYDFLLDGLLLMAILTYIYVFGKFLELVKLEINTS